MTLTRDLINFKKLQKKTRNTKEKEIMKNVHELYKKYYNAYKNDYDTDNELNEAKNKEFNNKQFKLVDKTDKESKLDEEAKTFFREIENREKCLMIRDL